MYLIASMTRTWGVILVSQLSKMRGGKRSNGAEVFKRVCSACHMVGEMIKQIAPIEFLDLIAFLQRQKAISMEVLRGGWIAAKSKADVKLREHNGFQEISRDASLQLDKTMNNEGWHNDVHLFMTDTESGDFDFAFHSEHKANQPGITIQLAKESEIRHVWLQNRLSPQFHQRAKGLSIWISLDGKDFKKVWAAKKNCRPSGWSIYPLVRVRNISGLGSMVMGLSISTARPCTGNQENDLRLDTAQAENTWRWHPADVNTAFARRQDADQRRLGSKKRKSGDRGSVRVFGALLGRSLGLPATGKCW